MSPRGADQRCAVQDRWSATANRPATYLNREKIEKFAPMLRKYYYGRGKFKTYLEQLGIKYRTVR